MTSPQKTASLTDIKKDRYGYRDPGKIVPSGGWGSYPTKPIRPESAGKLGVKAQQR